MSYFFSNESHPGSRDSACAIVPSRSRVIRLLGPALVTASVLAFSGCASMNGAQMKAMQSQIDAAMQQAKSAQDTANKAMALAKKHEAEMHQMGGPYFTR